MDPRTARTLVRWLRIAAGTATACWMLDVGMAAQYAGAQGRAPEALPIPSAAEAAYRAISAAFQPQRAMDVVTFMDRYWRLAGNTGFNASLEKLCGALTQAGYRDAGTRPITQPSPIEQGGDPTLWYAEYPNGGNGWEPITADLTVAAGDVPTPEGPGRTRNGFEPIFQTSDRVALAINSFSTPAGGISGPLYYVGKGATASDYEGKNLRGAVVLGDADIRQLWNQAVKERGARGVISTAVSALAKPDQTPDVLSWGGIPYDENLRSFGFKASPRQAARLKALASSGVATFVANVETRFNPGPGRLLIAEIPGTTRSGEHIVLVAHVQEPGAADNGSGCGTLLEVARVLASEIGAGPPAAANSAGGRVKKPRTGGLVPPSRTITFIWGDEIRASREYLRGDPTRAKTTSYMFSLDMTGEDVTRTGGTFLIEKEPDPTAVWPRPSDPHTEWGSGSYKAEALKGSLLNDLHLAICQRRARDTGWVVRTNPYEGGSDHAVFLASGVPALLDWHFPDRYYHTNLDRPDKVSAPEMGHVGISIATTAHFLASATTEDAMQVADLVVRAAEARLALERRQGADLVRAAGDPAAAEATERLVTEAWRKWYAEALESVEILPVSGPADALHQRVTHMLDRFRALK